MTSLPTTIEAHQLGRRWTFISLRAVRLRLDHSRSRLGSWLLLLLAMTLVQGATYAAIIFDNFDPGGGFHPQSYLVATAAVRVEGTPDLSNVQLREITLTLDPDQSFQRVTGSQQVEFPDPIGTVLAPLLPQKSASETNTGEDSNLSYQDGTIKAVVKFANGLPVRIQVTGGYYEPLDSGEYCPPPFPTGANQCPTEAAVGFAVGRRYGKRRSATSIGL